MSKRLLLLLLVMLLLTGCSMPLKDEERIPFNEVGSFNGYIEEEDSISVQMIVNGSAVTIPMSQDFVKDDTIEFGADVTISGDSDSAGENKVGSSINVNVIPVESQTGITAEELLAKDPDTIYQAIMVYVDYSYTLDMNGRISTGGINNKYYIKQDENISYKSIIGSTNTDGVSEVWSSLEYTDKNKTDRYYLYNYGTWEQSTGVRDVDVKLSMSSGYTVTDYELDGNRICIRGTVTDQSQMYLGSILDEVFQGESYYSNLDIQFESVYDNDTKQLNFVAYTVTTKEPIRTEKGSLTIDNMEVSMVLVDSNNNYFVEIPQYLINPAPVVEAVPDVSDNDSMVEEVPPEDGSAELIDESVPEDVDGAYIDQ